MKSNKDLLGKGISLLFVSSFFLQQAETMLKGTSWFRQENKQLLNLLLQKNSYVIEAEKKLVNLISDDTALNENNLLEDYNGNAEDVMYMFNNEKKIFIHFMKIFLEADDEKIASFSYDLEMIAQNKKLYTYDVMKGALKRFSDTLPGIKYNEEYLEEFLTDYK